MRFRGHVLGPVLVTLCNQAGGAPLIDRGFSRTDTGLEFEGRVILLTPWRRDSYGDSRPQRALFIGWRRRRSGEPVPPEGNGV